MTSPSRTLTVGVLALQGAFSEHVQLLRQAAQILGESTKPDINGSGNGNEGALNWRFGEVRTPAELAVCDALILPGGESTTMALVAARSGLLEPLREFVKVYRKPVWGTCAGLILLSESANRTKKGGQDLIGGLDVRVERNHFGRQCESFTADLDLPFLSATAAGVTPTSNSGKPAKPFRSVFIRAPIVEKILPHHTDGIQKEEAERDDTIVAPSKLPRDETARKAVSANVEVLARLPAGAVTLTPKGKTAREMGEEGAIIAVRQGNVFGTSFHPELTGDARIHVWWLEQVLDAVRKAE
ncbi:pyridoxine [Lineolata rhizophorae]|uniref:glutaminase n=1 Tax=Lineolata rhizophorae TaxID=578093 RepID=A0A6A6NQJ2_9PEZI|nr:pyridoxine [Lineolata rhizophorae]